MSYTSASRIYQKGECWLLTIQRGVNGEIEKVATSNKRERMGFGKGLGSKTCSVFCV